MRNPKAQANLVTLPTFSWQAGENTIGHLHAVPSIGRRIAYIITEPDINSRSGTVTYADGAAALHSCFVLVGVPIRNQMNRMRMEWGSSPFVLTLRDTDTFGELLIEMDPSRGNAAAYSVTIDRVMKGGVSYPSPRPEEQMINRIGRYNFDAVCGGAHEIIVKAIEQNVHVLIDGQEVLFFEDPDVAGGCFGIGTYSSIRLLSFEQVEYVVEQERDRREAGVREMNEFCGNLDAQYESNVAKSNRVLVEENRLVWQYPETGAAVALQAVPGRVTGSVHSGLYGNIRMLDGLFAYPEITDRNGEVFRPPVSTVPTLDADTTCFTVTIPIGTDSGRSGSVKLLFKLTENATWFCTAKVEGVEVRTAALAFGLDKAFTERSTTRNAAGKPAKLVYGTADLITDADLRDRSRSGFGLGAAPDPQDLPQSFLCTDAVVGHCWKALSGQDTKMEVREVDGLPALILRSTQPVFRWAAMWLPYHKLNLTGYKKRMVHFIRYPETPNHEWRERPSVYEYPTDEELERYAANGAKAMVWHHTWASNNFRRREGFVVNEIEMRRAMKKAHELGIAVIPYIGIVPGRHPLLRYEDLSARASYDKNWDLEDFTFYSVAGRFSEFFPFMTDYWCRTYGIDGFYTDGGLASLDWGKTELSEADRGGLSLEELNDRLYSRVKRVLRENGAGFGLENWGASGIHLAGPFYDCRMIGESFQETSPESYRDVYNPLLTGTPFKMYAMDLVARNRYNVAMAAVCMTDLQMCSGNYAWGNWPDRPSDWANVRPFWQILDSIDWDHLIDAKPWWAQNLLQGGGFYAGHYSTPERVVFFLANRIEDKVRVDVELRLEQLPEDLRQGKLRKIYPEFAEWTTIGDGKLSVDLPRLHDGPVGFEVVPQESGTRMSG